MENCKESTGTVPIDWSKPLRNVCGRRLPMVTYKSGGARVVWIEDRVYPVDEMGRCKAAVYYPGFHNTLRGELIVENVPEEPRDHVVVGYNRRTGETFLYQRGELTTATEARRRVADLPTAWPNTGYVAVKVPV
jgi:hypothetical protein